MTASIDESSSGLLANYKLLPRSNRPQHVNEFIVKGSSIISPSFSGFPFIRKYLEMIHAGTVLPSGFQNEWISLLLENDIRGAFEREVDRFEHFKSNLADAAFKTMTWLDQLSLAGLMSFISDGGYLTSEGELLDQKPDIEFNSPSTGFPISKGILIPRQPRAKAEIAVYECSPGWAIPLPRYTLPEERVRNTCDAAYKGLVRNFLEHNQPPVTTEGFCIYVSANVLSTGLLDDYRRSHIIPAA